MNGERHTLLVCLFFDLLNGALNGGANLRSRTVGVSVRGEVSLSRPRRSARAQFRHTVPPSVGFARGHSKRLWKIRGVGNGSVARNDSIRFQLQYVLPPRRANHRRQRRLPPPSFQQRRPAATIRFRGSITRLSTSLSTLHAALSNDDARLAYGALATRFPAGLGSAWGTLRRFSPCSSFLASAF